MMTTVYRIYSSFSSSSSSSSSILCTFIYIFLFYSQPIKKKRIFTENNSNKRNNVLRFRRYVLSDREKQNSQKFSGQRIFSGIESRTSLRNLSTLILSPCIVMGSFCLAINCAISWNINPFLKPSLGGEHISNTVFR